MPSSDESNGRPDYRPPDPEAWRKARQEAGGAVVEVFPGAEPGTYGAILHTPGDGTELPVEAGAVAIERIMEKLMEAVESPEDFSRVQGAIVARLVGSEAPAS